MPNGNNPHGKLKQEMATHIASLRRYAIALTRNTDEAEDLVQECLSRAIAGADTFRPDADLRVWLFRILHNVHVSGLRRRKLETAVKADADATAMQATEPAQHQHMEVREVMAALSQLPEDQRRAVTLIATEELKYDEAAKRLGVPIGTFMSRLGRGRAALRSMLNQARRPRLRLVGRSE
ncbi:RNA polymerase sigma-70 factor (ECF subfamily) [Skermanella aerolata]|uniref:DNA-directed RNA polymerase sigma-70 factor n=1 Tax=Skermanella aerolata TaxID=393310 RepID=A0A512DLW0_9PROT|nr:sigma-70 family RNA polymerase sigma factor [Skermanella aerolata]KJB96304.1 RNA polymerase sigma factor [Skermanella aerolata KACC 11604]GEO37459.1 DNA-directed RNA polymerase sigma-70 factor [Skermanella aerolata]